MNPNDLLFSETHEWVSVSRDEGGHKVATVGITAFAVEALTDLVYIQLPELGRQVEAGKPFGEIESVKAVSDLYSPVSGMIIDVNHKLADKLEILSDDPYGAGWMVRIRISDETGLSKLMNLAAYEKQCCQEGH